MTTFIVDPAACTTWDVAGAFSGWQWSCKGLPVVKTSCRVVTMASKFPPLDGDYGGTVHAPGLLVLLDAYQPQSAATPARWCTHRPWPVQGGRGDPKFAGNGSETVVEKEIPGLGQG